MTAQCLLKRNDPKLEAIARNCDFVNRSVDAMENQMKRLLLYALIIPQINAFSIKWGVKLARTLVFAFETRSVQCTRRITWSFHQLQGFFFGLKTCSNIVLFRNSRFELLFVLFLDLSAIQRADLANPEI